MALVSKRFDIYLVCLDPTLGSVMQKTRPCLIISPDEINQHIRAIIIAPMTSTSKNYPTRVSCLFREKQGHIVLDQLRTIDKTKLIKRLGTIEPDVQAEVISVLQQMFSF